MPCSSSAKNWRCNWWRRFPPGGFQPFHRTNRVNRLPRSPAPGRTRSVPLAWDAEEAKFQLSFKIQVFGRDDLSLLGFESARVFAAYTQQSNWQLYSSARSSPFRETNYEPELILSLGRGGDGGVFRLVNLGLVHQSNGRSNPDSRSWNRLYVQGGWEWHSVSLLVRGWRRIPESEDDNPDIERYAGYGDIAARWETRGLGSVSLVARHALGAPRRGFVQLDWTTRELMHSVRPHVQLTSGYGESLIDYNFQQTTLGVGLSLGGG